MMKWLLSWLSPREFYRWSGYCLPWLGLLTVIVLGYGLFAGLVVAPADYQQGDAFRIIYLHVPSAFLSLLVYGVMAIAAIMSLIWRIKVTEIVVAVSARLGAWFTLLALITGSLWGKPMWGTWWIWDARLTSELILLFLYLGVIALQNAMPDNKTSARASQLLAIVGVINIPIIHYSVYWWSTLHQGATLSKFAKPSIDASMLQPLLVMIVGFLLYYVVLLLWRVRQELLLREQQSEWVKVLIKQWIKV